MGETPSLSRTVGAAAGASTVMSRWMRASVASQPQLPGQRSVALLCLRQHQLLQRHQHLHQLQDLLITVHRLASLMRPPMSLLTILALTLVPSVMQSALLILTAQPTLLVAPRSQDASSKILTLVTRPAVWSVGIFGGTCPDGA